MRTQKKKSHCTKTEDKMIRRKLLEYKWRKEVMYASRRKINLFFSAKSSSAGQKKVSVRSRGS